jgi:hypothetical protein
MKILEIVSSGIFAAISVTYLEEGKQYTYCLMPNADLTKQPVKVVEAADEYFTDEIKALYLAHLESKKPAPLTDNEIINGGVFEMSEIVNGKYTPYVWKGNLYGKKQTEAAYVMEQAPSVILDPEKCRLLTAEVAVKSKFTSVRQLAALVIVKVKEYEQMTIGVQSATVALEAAVPAAITQEAKLLVRNQIVSAFKAAVGD